MTSVRGARWAFVAGLLAATAGVAVAKADPCPRADRTPATARAHCDDPRAAKAEAAASSEQKAAAPREADRAAPSPRAADEPVGAPGVPVLVGTGTPDGDPSGGVHLHVR